MFNQLFFDSNEYYNFEKEDSIVKVVSLQRKGITRNDLGELISNYVEIAKIDVFISPFFQDYRNIEAGDTEVQKWKLFCSLDESVQVSDKIVDGNDSYKVETVTKFLDHLECEIRKI